MDAYLGIDTSNYTTSAALAGSGGLIQKKRLLHVKEGGRGLQQSEALFQHVKNLPGLMGELFAGRDVSVRAVGASVFPRDESGSYMPCFLAGEGTARSSAAAMGVPFFPFSHQSDMTPPA